MNFCHKCTHCDKASIALGVPDVCYSPAFKEKRDTVSGRMPFCHTVKDRVCQHFEAEEEKPPQKNKWWEFWK